MLRYFLLTMAVSMVPVSAVAQDAALPRYQMREIDGGIVRLDTVTGEMTLCRQQQGTLTCAAAAAAEGASDNQIAELRARIDALEKQLADLHAGDAQMPDDAAVEKGLSIMEKFMRRFMGLAREFDRENGARKPNHCDPLPQSGGTCL